MLSPAQIKMVKTAQRALDLDDDDYREILRVHGGVDSCTKLDNRSFERVMRHFETCGFHRFSGPSGDRFRMRKFHAGLFASPEERHKISELAAQAGIEVPGFVARMTRGRLDSLDKVTPREAYNVIEGLKKIIARQSPRQHRERSAEGSATVAPAKDPATGMDAGTSQEGWQEFGPPIVPGVSGTSATADDSGDWFA